MILDCFLLLQNNSNTANKHSRLHSIMTNKVFWGEGVQRRELYHHKTENNKLVEIAFSL